MSLVKSLLGLVVLCALSGSSQAQSEHEKLRRIDRVLADVLGAHKQIQAVSFTIYNGKDGSTVTKDRSYNNGRITADQSARVPHCVGGITQGLTAILVQKLLSESNHTWFTPIQDIVGHKVVLPDKYRSDKINLRDVMAMRSGLAGMDIVPVVGAFGRKQIPRKLKYLPEESGFRSKYVHNIILYTLVDEVVEKLSGMLFEDAMKAHILYPMNMNKTEFFWAAPLNRHLSYSRMISSANTLCVENYDMSLFFHQLHAMSTDSPDRILRADQLNELFQGIQNRGKGDPIVEGYEKSAVTMGMTREQNGLGWIVGHVDYHRAVSLSGSFVFHDQSLLTYLPDKKIGVFVTFFGTGDAKDFAAKVLLTERLLRLELNKYSTSGVMRKEQTEIAFNSMSDFPTLPRDRAYPVANCDVYNQCRVQRPLDEFEGVFKNYAYGKVKVFFNQSGDGKLQMEYGDAVYELRPMTSGNDTFQLKPLEGDFYTTFAFVNTVPTQAMFKAAQDDPENRIFSVTISGFDRYMDPEFSLNPREPEYEGRAAASCGGSSDDGDSCSACGLIVSIWTLALALLVLRL